VLKLRKRLWQSLIKKLDKVERIEVDEDDNSVMNISFPVSKEPGKVVIEADNVTKGNNVILKEIDLLVERGVKLFCRSKWSRKINFYKKAIVRVYAVTLAMTTSNANS
jgi:ATP-binding cassette subfamily F protein 3